MRRTQAIRTGKRLPWSMLTLGCALALGTASPGLTDIRLQQGLPDDGIVDSDETLRIRGKAVNELVIETLASSSRGGGAASRVDAQTVTRTKVGGDLTLESRIGELIQHAEGMDSQAATVVGTIRNTTVGGRLSNTVTVGRSTNIAIGRGAVACTELGIFGPSGVCR